MLVPAEKPCPFRSHFFCRSGVIKMQDNEEVKVIIGIVSIAGLPAHGCVYLKDRSFIVPEATCAVFTSQLFLYVAVREAVPRCCVGCLEISSGAMECNVVMYQRVRRLVSA